MVTFGNELVNSKLKDKNKRKASLIVNTGKLVLTQIKMLLDRNMLENGNLIPQI
jgi:hypothetical protein